MDYKITKPLHKIQNKSAQLLDLFERIRTQCPDTHNFFYLNAKELKPSVVKKDFLSNFIDEFCKKLNENEEESSRWTILLACITEENLNPNSYGSIKKESFLRFEGFEQEDTEKLFLRQSNFRITPEEAKRCARKIHTDWQFAPPIKIKKVLAKLIESSFQVLSGFLRI